MSTTPARRPRNQETAGLFVQVAPEAKGLVDRWASTANANRWEIVEALIFEAHLREDPDGLPTGLGFTPQPQLEVSASSEGSAAAA